MTNYAVKTFITEEEFICKFLNPGIPYEGFIVGMGYAFTRPKSLLPPNNNGQVHIRNIPANGTFALLCYEQCIDNSPEAIKLSLKGFNGTFLYKVKPGDTLQSIAALFDISPDKIREWNDLKKNHSVMVGQKLYISPDERKAASANDKILIIDDTEKKENPITKSAEILLKVSDNITALGDMYWKRIGKKGQQQHAYEIQKILKRTGNRIKTRDLKGSIGKGLRTGGYIIGIQGLALDGYNWWLAKDIYEKIDSGTNVVVDIGGLSGNPYGGAFALYWGLGGEWLYKNWREKVIPSQMNLGIEGYAASMPFK